MISLRTLARVAVSAYVIKVAALVGISAYTLREVAYHHSQTGAITTALSAFRGLELATTDYFRSAWAAASAGRISEALMQLERRDELSLAQSKARTAVLAEISLLRTTEERISETNEIEVIDRIVHLTDGHKSKMRVALMAVAESSGPARTESLAAARAVADSALFGELSQMIDRAVSHEVEETLEAEAVAHRQQKLLLILPLIVAVFTTILVGLLGHYLIQMVLVPVSRMRTALAQLEADPLTSADFTIQGPDEMRSLTRAFNRLSAVLRTGAQRADGHRLMLERKSAERAAELERINARLVEMDRERTRFLADISHEIRSPLTLIRGEAEIALRRREPLVEEQRDALRRIGELSGQIALLIEDLLFLARQREAGAPLMVKDIDTAALFTRAREDAMALARSRRLQVRAEIPVQSIHLRGDAGRMRQAILILLDNAVRYAADDGLIEISAISAQGRVLISVANDGPGIDAQELPYVFDRYFRGISAAGRAPEGAGLGLVLAKAIALAHGGDLLVESTPGKRTVFTLDLPATG